MPKRIPKTNPFADLDFEDYLHPKEEETPVVDYVELCRKRFIKPIKAWKVVFTDIKDLYFITFQSNREQARWDACDFFRKTMHPQFLDKGWWRRCYDNSRALRAQAFDKYAKDGFIPIPAFLKEGFTLPCSVCGKGNFSYSDYEKGRCFILEGEGNILPYLIGCILCYDCYKKYIK